MSANRNRSPCASLLGKFLAQDLHVRMTLTPVPIVTFTRGHPHNVQCVATHLVNRKLRPTQKRLSKGPQQFKPRSCVKVSDVEVITKIVRSQANLRGAHRDPCKVIVTTNVDASDRDIIQEVINEPGLKLVQCKRSFDVRRGSGRLSTGSGATRIEGHSHVVQGWRCR